MRADPKMAHRLAEEMRNTIKERGFGPYLSKLSTYGIAELSALSQMMSDGPSRLHMVGYLYDASAPRSPRELRKDIGYSFLVAPSDLRWFSRHYGMRDSEIDDKYNGRRLDCQALITAKVRMADIERMVGRLMVRRTAGRGARAERLKSGAALPRLR